MHLYSFALHNRASLMTFQYTIVLHSEEKVFVCSWWDVTFFTLFSSGPSTVAAELWNSNERSWGHFTQEHNSWSCCSRGWPGDFFLFYFFIAMPDARFWPHSCQRMMHMHGSKATDKTYLNYTQENMFNSLVLVGGLPTVAKPLTATCKYSYPTT